MAVARDQFGGLRALVLLNDGEFPNPIPACVLFDSLLLKIFDICFVVCRYAGSPCPRIARASRIATMKSWEFFPTVRDLSMNFNPRRVISPGRGPQGGFKLAHW